MEIQEGSDGDEYIIGPLRAYKCDGMKIESAGKTRYKLHVYEVQSGTFDPNLVEEYEDKRPNQSLHVFLNDEEMEALFLAWQMLKKTKGDG